MISFSVIIIAYGNEQLLEKCIDSLRPGTEKWQLIVVANGVKLSEQIQSKIHLMSCESQILQTDFHMTPGKAKNLALESVQYDWVYFIDENSFILAPYFEMAFPLLIQERIGVLGGPDLPAKGLDDLSLAYAFSMGSPFCSGRSFIRHRPQGKHLREASEEILSSSNLWIRTPLLRANHFPEHYLKSEETALLLDLERQKTGIFYHPDLKVAQRRQVNLKSIFLSTLMAGHFRSAILKDKSIQSAKTFYLPSLFVCMHLLIFLSPNLFWYLARIYGGIIVMMSLNLASRKRKIGLFGHIAFLHYFIVMVYGIGFLFHRLGLGRHLKKQSGDR